MKHECRALMRKCVELSDARLHLVIDLFDTTTCMLFER